jgi:hypothetical protein
MSKSILHEYIMYQQKSAHSKLYHKLQLINTLKQKYRGLDENDLDPLFPQESCVLCARIGCREHNTPKHSCVAYQQADENDFAHFYKFKK